MFELVRKKWDGDQDIKKKNTFLVSYKYSHQKLYLINFDVKILNVISSSQDIKKIS